MESIQPPVFFAESSFGEVLKIPKSWLLRGSGGWNGLDPPKPKNVCIPGYSTYLGVS